MKKRIPIGIDNFKKLIATDFYYVDKTMMLKELLDKQAEVSLFTRPRRFGKTLTLSMIQTFFELELDDKGKAVDNSAFFQGMKIMKEHEEYTGQMGKYPVIFLTLKSAKQPDFHTAYSCLCEAIADEFKRHGFILQANVLSDAEKDKFKRICDEKAEYEEMSTSLVFLAKCLKKYHKQDVIILIDEYDVPLENAYTRDFYDEMVSFLRSLFESALKTNTSLKFAVITGCLRISKESIFTGLNNLEVISILNEAYSESFGFLTGEVKKLLEDYGLPDKMEEVKQWYDGYRFGRNEVYNPWSVLKYVKFADENTESYPQPYWSQTSSNSIIRELIEHADVDMREEIETLINGNSIEKPIHEDITYDDIHRTQDNLWNFLFFTGYLKNEGIRQQDENLYIKLAIPNGEVRYIYRNTILGWFDEKVQSVNMDTFIQAVENEDSEKIGTFLSNQLLETISFYDYAENYYHGFLAGILKNANAYRIVSNRESGTGRSDIIMKCRTLRGMAILFELKVAKTYQEMEIECDRALAQIEEMQYEKELQNEGYQKIIKYGVCFYKKECLVKAK